MVRWLRGSPRPRPQRQSLYEFIAACIEPATGKLSSECLELPDEKAPAGPSDIGVVPGFGDGMGTHHAAFKDLDGNASQVARRLVRIARLGRATDMDEFEAFVSGKDTLTYVDAVQDELAKANAPKSPQLRRLALRLVREGYDRGAVKMGIALLGWVGLPEDAEPLRVLGLHDEFSLFAAVALKSMLGPEDAENELWTLAKGVDGWGRIQVVEHLVPPRNPAVREWLLRGGYRNTIMNEYLTWIAAVHGNLAETLQRSTIDDELFDSIGEIIDGLVAGGPAKDISDYPQGPEALARYLELLKGRPEAKLQHFLVARSIEFFLDHPDRLRPAWTDEQVTKCRADADAILHSPVWIDLAKDALHAPDRKDFFVADRAAGLLGIDRYPALIARIESDPEPAWLWAEVLKAAGPDRVDEALHLASKKVPLEPKEGEMTSMLAVDPLGMVVLGLVKYPGKGLPFLLAGLRHPGVRGRLHAASALAKWPALPEEARDALAQARANETHEETRTMMDRALALPHAVDPD